MSRNMYRSIYNRMLSLTGGIKMEQYKCKVVDLGYYNSEKSVVVEVDEGTDEIGISAVVDGINFFASDESYLVAYQKFRDELLKLGYGLQCNGSRVNAIQSGMMGACDKVYLVEMGKRAVLDQIACIWDYADIDFFPDTKEQLEFATKWYECKKE